MWDRLRTLPPVSGPEGVRAAVLVPLYEDGDDIRVILTKRPDDMRTHPGQVAFPGGRIDPEDDGPVAAALREAWEEVALPPDHVEEIFGGLPLMTTNRAEMVIAPVVARVRRPADLIPEPGEVDLILEPTLGELLDDAAWITEPWEGFTMWFYEFPEATLWGATAFIMRSLIAHLRDEPLPEPPVR
ncbi:MAG: CoA pyrophosphatase [Acidimicrobiia bacterium]|nr:CoA pyrophosphatase [Acidimicrobiia bacterium]